jgi:hypothetical protein
MRGTLTRFFLLFEATSWVWIVTAAPAGAVVGGAGAGRGGARRGGSRRDLCPTGSREAQNRDAEQQRAGGAGDGHLFQGMAERT